MNKSRRSTSCPSFISQTSRTLRREVSNNKRLLKRIQRHYHRRLPRLLGKPIKLCDLFVAVISRGGYKTVCDRGLWLDVARELNLPLQCANASVGLRRIYYQFLSHFEIKEYPALSEQFLVQTLVEPDIEPESICLPLSAVERSLGIGTSHQHGYMTSHSAGDFFDRSYRSRFFPLTQEYGQTNREYSVLSQDNDTSDSNHSDEFPDLYEPSQLRLVESALCSGLPNEIEVALNALLVLSITPSSGSSTSVRLAHCTNLLSLLLASVGIYSEGFGSYISCDETWRRQSQLDFLKFWYNVVRQPSGRVFLRPDVFINAEYTSDEIDTDEEKALNELFAPSSSEFYRSHWCMEGCEGSRVLLIATILVNLVTPPPVVYTSSIGEDDDDELDFGPITPCSLFPNGIPLATWRDNARVIAANPNALRFIYLCCYAQHSGLKSLGLQLLSSIRYPLDPPSVPLPLDCPNDWTPLIDNGCRLGQLTLAFLTRCILESNDRCDLIAGLMFLANLTKVRDKGNLSSLVVGLPQTVWPRLAQLLCLPDLAIVCATLEAMRCLTNLDATTCVTCWESCCSNLDSLDGGNIPFILLQPLLALLTLEGQAMGSQSLHRIRLLPRNPQIQSQPQPSHAPNFRIPVPSRIPPPSVNDHNRYREPLHANSGQTFKTYILPKSPSKLHSIPSDSNSINDLRNPATSSFHSLKSESSTPLKPSIITPVVSCMPQPVYRPQSGSTACSGLINLLSSTTPSSSSSSSSNLSVSSTPDSPTSNSIINTSPKTMTPSLSELTDRLQMPPPSLPPPSALRRSGKWPQPRNSLPSSPPPPLPPPPSSSSQLINKSKMPTPNSPCRTNYSSGNMPVMTDHRISSSSSSQLSVTSSSSKSLCSSENSTPSEKEDIEPSSILTEKHVHIDSPVKLPPNESMIKANSSRNSPPHLKSISNHEDCDNNNNNKNSSNPPSPCVVPVVVDSETKPILVNGDEGNSVVVDDKELLNSHADMVVNSKHKNGLRTGILQEAVLALQDKKSIKLSTTEQSKSADHDDDDKQHIINGVHYTGETKAETPDSNIVNTAELDGGKSNHIDNCEGLIVVTEKKLDKSSLSNGYLTDDMHVSTKNCNPSTKDISSNNNIDLIKNNNNNNSDKLEKISSISFQAMHPSNRFLKRRRKWGSKSRLFTPKRRRDLINTTTNNNNNGNLTGTVAAHCNTSASLNALLRLNPVPGSVLDPTWKPNDDSSSNKTVVSCGGSGGCGEVVTTTTTTNNLSADYDSKISTTISTEVKNQLNSCEKNECRTSESQVECGVDSINPVNHHHHDQGAKSSEGQSTTTVNMEKPVLYLCEWECCTATFEQKHLVAQHVYLTHLPNKETWKSDSSHHANHKYPVQLVRRCCRWRGCQSASLARAPYALMTHVLDMHCSPKELEARRSTNSEHKKITDTQREHCYDVNPSSSSTAGVDLIHSEYPYVGDRSAWAIIRSIEAKSTQNDLWAAQHHFFLTNPHCQSNMPINHPFIHNNPPREGPVTKHLRVTSALILRNLVLHIEEARQWLLKESQLLSEIAFGCTPSETGLRTNNAGHIIAQCLSICTLKKKKNKNKQNTPSPPIVNSFIMKESMHQNIPSTSLQPHSPSAASSSTSSSSSRIQSVEFTSHRHHRRQYVDSTVDLDSDVFCN
ncbi:unnamed protein product [Trichobilharzia szidati]|nr:unnamed protein product [Trichobilharzia szidati]